MYHVRPPCENHAVFTDPTNHTPTDIADAVEMCHHCPLRKDCAKQAIVAGDTLDGERRATATDVIQAGIWLNGRRKRINELYKLAGVTPLAPRTRKPTPTRCKHCHRAMIPRDKSISLDSTIVTHAAHGYCRVCYAALKRHGRITTQRAKHQAVLGWREHHKKKGTPNAK